MNFTISVTGMYRRDAMPRQVSSCYPEMVALGFTSVETIINTKKEWNYVQLPKVVVIMEMVATKHFLNAMILPISVLPPLL